MIYEKDWIKRLVTQSHNFPNDCIVENGVDVCWHLFKCWEKKNHNLYRFLRILSLGIWNPKMKYSNNEFFDCIEGSRGVLIKPSFFSDEVFDIPDIIWTVDDIWLSGILSKNNIKIRKTENTIKSYGLKEGECNFVQTDSSLSNYTYEGFNREMANCLAILFCNQKFKIWNEKFSICRIVSRRLKSIE